MRCTANRVWMNKLSKVNIKDWYSMNYASEVKSKQKLNNGKSDSRMTKK